ncbi:TrmH family RNA methyltransferase [Candidatus Soleaferrea massiliensis]|uniref:TrmH family RNA methyltransferase n=1 Tax=Candidatus Soleaferrea massiliensis TaxID=1470354 RepID=UPI0018CDA2B1|nr:RNA methyltransferase [Candidatus Soleaferrea massiliensis]
MEQITSRDNANIKLVQKLLKSRGARYENRQFAAEGIKLCMEALESGIVIEKLFCTRTALEKYAESARRLSAAAGQSFEITDGISQKIADTKSPQGVYCICKMLDKRRNAVTIGNSEKFLGLVDLQDPGNIGTIIRTAEAMGIDGVFMTASCADLYSPKVLRSTMGSAFRVPIYIASTPEELLSRFQKHKTSHPNDPSDDWTVRFAPGSSMKVVAAALQKESVTLDKLDTAGSMMVLIGNEGNGLDEAVIAQCDETVFIPMEGQIESLNASVAAALLMWRMTKEG